MSQHQRKMELENGCDIEIGDESKSDVKDGCSSQPHDELLELPDPNDSNTNNDTGVRVTIKHVVKKPYKFAKKKVKKQKYKVKSAVEEHKYKVKLTYVIINACLTLFDVVSDLVLAVNYFRNESYWWGGLTLAFFSVPFIIGVILVCEEICKRGFKSCLDPTDLDDEIDQIRNEKVFFRWILWKGVAECVLESGPQLILQLYIMALPTDSTLPDSNDTTGKCNFQCN